MQAIERYDGPAFKVIRRYLREQEASTFDIKILSAKYGLISAEQPIPNYDCRITRQSSYVLNRQALASLKNTLIEKDYSKFLICLGKDYLKAISGYEKFLPTDLPVQIAEGGIGRKLSILHDWLYEESSKFKHFQASDTYKREAVYLRGIKICMSPSEILDIARNGILREDNKAFQYQSWCIQIDDEQVSPKWLVSQITGLSVSKFVTDEARRVLSQLGIEVKRV